MLKQKLTKAGLLSHGFLLIIPYHVGIIKNDHHYRQTAGTASERNRAYADTSVVTVPDSSFTPETELPKTIAPPTFYLNAATARFVRKYIRNNNEELQKVKDRSSSYFRTIEYVFHKNELPGELKYLAVVESELNTRAVSHAGAVGLWQLMAQTARDYGLKVTKKTDERKHFYKSTEAAARYLKSLYSEFNDWLLVLAAYNSGSGTVSNAIHRSGSHNFWKLQYFLPAETRGHVKRFISTHYFFEREGGLTTITKEETVQYKNTVTNLMAGKDAKKEIASVR